MTWLRYLPLLSQELVKEENDNQISQSQIERFFKNNKLQNARQTNVLIINVHDTTLVDFMLLHMQP